MTGASLVDDFLRRHGLSKDVMNLDAGLAELGHPLEVGLNGA